MNYWKQFAKMLGLELGQEFEIKDEDGKRKINTYIITENGLYYKEKTGAWFSVTPVALNLILKGKYEVVHKPWKPKKGDTCWYYSIGWKRAISLTWEGETIDSCLWKGGNCFKTEEEAKTKGKKIMEQIQKEFEVS